MELTSLGWNSRFASAFEQYDIPDLVPARVIEGQRDLCAVFWSKGELLAEMSGRFRMEAADGYGYPVVGDWVAVVPRPGNERATIHAILPRSSSFVRKAPAGASARRAKTQQQVVAANIDAAVIVMGLDQNFNLRRLERYLTLAWASGALPLVVLNKADLCDDAPGRLVETMEAAVGVDVLVVSAETGQGLEELASKFAPGKTATLLGSSGVGKSTIINRLCGERRMATGAVREDDHRGRHMTTHRELVILPSGAILIDNPGMREVGLWADEGDLGDAFSDIEELARSCRFSDCSHWIEPDCAVRAALRDGALSEGRYKSWRTLQRELAHLASREDVSAYLAKRKRGKTIARHQRAFRKDRRG